MTDREANDPTERVEWDDEVRSLGRRIRANGSERWIVQMRVGGRMRKRVIGDARKLDARDARRAAIVAMERMRIGADVPVAVSPPAPFVRVRDFGNRYLKDHAPHWKPSTRKAHAKCLEWMVYPILGDKRVVQLTRADIKAWREEQTCAPSSINRAMAVLSGMMRHAEVLGVRQPGDNPCKGLRKKETSFKAVYLSRTGYLNLGRALRALSDEHPTEAALIRFLAVTGCRRSEAQDMEWDWVTEDAVRLPDSKSGPRSIWLGKAARDVLTQIERRGRYVFSEDGRPIPDHRIAKAWAKVRERLNKPMLRIHDLRHSFASVGVRHGEDLGTIGGLLGHADKATTAGYAHLAEAPVRAAADRVGDLIAVKSRLERSCKMEDNAVETGFALAPAPTPEDPWALVRAFLKSGVSIPRWCKRRGVDPDDLRRQIRACRRARGGLL